MRVNFYVTFRILVGSKTVDLPLPEGITVRELLRALVTTYPQLRGAAVDENGSLLAHVHLFVNGRAAQYLPAAMMTRLNSEDKIDIFPPIGGGVWRRSL